MTDDASATSASTTDLSSTTEELFRIWQASCLNVENDPSSKSQSLRKEACSVLKSLVQGTEIVAGGVVMKTKASHEEALAVLIRELGPAFRTGHHASRICALATLTGAMEGCHTAVLSPKIVNLLGAFLVGHCGPIQQEDESSLIDEDYDEQIRDAAVAGLSVLLSGSAAGLSEDDLIQTLSSRLDLAQTGVERRCAAPEFEDKMDYDTGYGDGPVRPRVQSGLATLPRSRRALCFALLRSVTDGFAATVREQPPSVQVASQLESKLVAFASFAASCLHGESDPRCLLQLLQLLGTLLGAFQPFFAVTKSGTFPITDLFDAVAPYYPIQFTPPPNDVHGISKAGLRQALLSILASTDYDTAAAEQEQDTMLQLTLGIVLERLVPPEEDGPSTTTDKLEAIQDIDSVLFTGELSSCAKMDTMTVHQLSNVFLVIHDEASMAFAKGGAEEKQAKEVADLCRIVVAKIALDLEQTSERVLWQTFVLEPLQAMASRLASSPSQSRTAIAYVACLCACGGPKTLRCSLEAALVPLFDTVSSDTQDDADVVTAAYGIGAFFSSSRLAVAKAKENGVVIHPHPLEKYCGPAVDKLSALVGEQPGTRNVSPRVEAAAIRAMESVLLVSPAEHFTSDHIEKASRVVKAIVAHVTEDSAVNDASESRDVRELRHACAVTLGNLLGKVLDNGDSKEGAVADEPQCILEVETVRSFVFLRFTFATLMTCAGRHSESKISQSYEKEALTLACSASRPGASRIVGSLVKSLYGALRQDTQGESSRAYTASLSYILRHGGGFASQAFLDLSAPSVTPIDLLDSLVASPVNNTTGASSNLKLPPTVDDYKQKLNVVYTIIVQLLPAYDHQVPKAHLQKLVSIVSPLLPPLSEADTAKLSVYLPVFAAAIERCNFKNSADSTVVEGDWTSITNDLVGFALDTENHSSARSYSVACVHALISRLIPIEAGVCPSLALLQTVVVPTLHELTSADYTKRGAESVAAAVAKVMDILSITAVVGSAAACRGGSSSKTADSVVLFLVDLACSKESSGFYFGSVSHSVKLMTLDADEAEPLAQVSTGLAIAAASAFGSMLSTETGSPLLNQRLTHNAVKQTVARLTDTASAAAPDPSHLAAVALACHLVCSSSLRNIAASDVTVITDAVVNGLVSVSAFSVDAESTSAEARLNVLIVKKIVLAAAVKIICAKQTDTPPSRVYLIVTGLMRAYAATTGVEPTAEIACKLLALQGLANVTLIKGSRDTLRVVQKAVVSILSAAMNHPSSILRRAAIEARNAWFIID